VPEGIEHEATGKILTSLKYPSKDKVHENHVFAMVAGTSTAFLGLLLASLMYLFHKFSPEAVRRQFPGFYRLLWNKWWFDEIYQVIFVRPVMFLARLVFRFDRAVIDWFVDNTARWTVKASELEDKAIDRTVIDGLANLTASWIYSFGLWLRIIQTGKLRQYVMFIVVGTVLLFVAITFVQGYLMAS